jgi:hypothetical protein
VTLPVICRPLRVLVTNKEGTFMEDRFSTEFPGIMKGINVRGSCMNSDFLHNPQLKQMILPLKHWPGPGFLYSCWLLRFLWSCHSQNSGGAFYFHHSGVNFSCPSMAPSLSCIESLCEMLRRDDLLSSWNLFYEEVELFLQVELLQRVNLLQKLPRCRVH